MLFTHSLTDGNKDRLFMRKAKGQINILATSLLADGISLEGVCRSATRQHAVTPTRDEKLTGKQLPQHDDISRAKTGRTLKVQGVQIQTSFMRMLLSALTPEQPHCNGHIPQSPLDLG